MEAVFEVLEMLQRMRQAVILLPRNHSVTLVWGGLQAFTHGGAPVLGLLDWGLPCWVWRKIKGSEESGVSSLQLHPLPPDDIASLGISSSPSK